MIYQNCGDTEREAEPGMERPVQAGYPYGRQIRRARGMRDAERTKSSEAAAPGCQEKPLSCISCPYRKPTQVDEERILRPAGEVLLRNSAK